MKEQRNRSQLKSKLRAAQAQQGQALSRGKIRTPSNNGADGTQPSHGTC